MRRFAVCAAVAAAAVLVVTLYAEVYTRDEALARLFPGYDGISTRVYGVPGKEQQKIRDTLAKRFVQPPGAAGYDLSALEVSVVMRGGTEAGRVITASAMGRWNREIRILIQIDPDDGKVMEIVALKCEERRGNISHRFFQRQFTGKGPDSPLDVNCDIAGVTGATVSSSTVCYMVKRALLMYRAAVLDGKEG